MKMSSPYDFSSQNYNEHFVENCYSKHFTYFCCFCQFYLCNFLRKENFENDFFKVNFTSDLLQKYFWS